MEYEHEDEITGKKTNYEISYSQELQTKIAKELKIGNRLKIGILLGFVIIGIIGILILTNSGTVGEIIRLGFCS